MKRSIAIALAVFMIVLICATPTYANGEYFPTLMIGSSGEAVVELQQALSNKGYYDDVVDGWFGPCTQSAVLCFQDENNLTVDGIVGPETWSALQLNNSLEVYELARIIFCESAGTSKYTQWLVGSAAYNLVHYEGRNYRDPYAFEVNYYSEDYFDNHGQPMELQMEIAKRILSGDRSDVRYFQTGEYHDFGTPYCFSDGVYFSLP